MRYIRKRRFPIRYRRMGKHRTGKRLFAVALVLLFLWTAVTEAGLSSVSQELTEEAAREYLLTSINTVVREELEERNAAFVTVSRSGNGTVSAVNANVSALNSLKAGIIARLSKALNGKASAWVPVGSFTEVGVLNGRGPKVPVKLNLEGSADVTFQTEFRSAGVNQSCHRIVMAVTARAYSQSKRFEIQVEEETSTVLAETVVVGEVPDIAYAGIG